MCTRDPKIYINANICILVLFIFAVQYFLYAVYKNLNMSNETH